ncbi:MAG: AEC family transporter [Paracoccaceae bacterium]
MTDIFLIILPLILLVATGWAITRARLLSDPHWQGIEKFSFIILIPALLIRAIYRSDLSLSIAGPYVASLILTVTAMGLLTLTLRLAFSHDQLPSADLSSMFQATTRWNGFIVLLIAAQLFGEPGLGLVAIAMAALIPLINIANITVLSTMLTQSRSLKSLATTILRNPLVIASLTGLAINLTGLQVPASIDTTLDLIGRGALAIGLLVIGAGFDWQRLLRPSWHIFWGVALKLIAAPALMFVLANLFQLNALQTTCAMLVVSAPTASNGYIIARQMGGNAGLYAHTMSWQLVLSILTIPAIIWLTTP